MVGGRGFSIGSRGGGVGHRCCRDSGWFTGRSNYVVFLAGGRKGGFIISVSLPPLCAAHLACQQKEKEKRKKKNKKVLFCSVLFCVEEMLQMR